MVKLKHINVIRFLKPKIFREMKEVKRIKLKNNTYEGIGIYPYVFMMCRDDYLELFTYVPIKYKGEEYLIPMRAQHEIHENFNLDFLRKLRENFMLDVDRLSQNTIPIINGEPMKFEFVKIIND